MNNLPKVVAQQRRGRASNPRLVDRKSDALPLSHRATQLVEYRTSNREVAGSTHTRSTASNLQQVANLLCAQANSPSYPQWDEK